MYNMKIHTKSHDLIVEKFLSKAKLMHTAAGAINRKDLKVAVKKLKLSSSDMKKANDIMKNYLKYRISDTKKSKNTINIQKKRKDALKKLEVSVEKDIVYEWAKNSLPKSSSKSMSKSRSRSRTRSKSRTKKNRKMHGGNTPEDNSSASSMSFMQQRFADVSAIITLLVAAGVSAYTIYWVLIRGGFVEDIDAAYSAVEHTIAGCSQIPTGLRKRKISDLINWLVDDGSHSAQMIPDCEQAWARIHELDRKAWAMQKSIYGMVSFALVVGKGKEYYNKTWDFWASVYTYGESWVSQCRRSHSSSAPRSLTPPSAQNSSPDVGKEGKGRRKRTKKRKRTKRKRSGKRTMRRIKRRRTKRVKRRRR